MKHSADLILRGLWAGVAGSLCLTFASELSLRAKRGICSCCAWNDVWGKTAGPSRPKLYPGSAVRDDNSEIAKPDITYTALNKAPGRYRQLGCGPEAPHYPNVAFFLQPLLPVQAGYTALIFGTVLFCLPRGNRQSQKHRQSQKSVESRGNFPARKKPCCSLRQRFDDGIVHKRPDLADRLRHSVWPRAVGQQCDRKLARGIDPQGGAGESEMTKRRRRKMSARRCRRRRSVPPQRSRRTGRRFHPSREKLHGFRLEDGRSAAQHAFSEARDVACRSEDAGMSSYASHHGSVLVIHFALDDALAKSAIVFGGRNPRLPLCWRIESRMGHPERSKDFLPRKEVERHASLAGQHFSQQDEAHVAVLGARARRGNQPRGKRGPNEFLARGGNLKQLLVSRQSAGVGKQHEQGDRLSRGTRSGRAYHA